MRRLLAAFSFLAGLLPALAAAQAPPPVAALPDTERRTSYSLTASTCACSVGFQIYATGVDIDAWIEVWLNGSRVLSNDAAHPWAITSATGSLATIPRPITNAVLTFTNAETGPVQILGAERPRRLAQFSENRGVAARDLNLAFTDVVSTQRELWDKTNDVTGRGLFGLPGEAISTMPAAATRAGKFLYFDATGLIPQFTTGAAGTGNVVGPPSSTSGHLALWDNTTGTLLRDANPYTIVGRVIASLPDTVTAFYTATTTAGSTSLTLTGAAFTSADVGKYLICDRIGSTELRLTTTISAVTDGTHITTASPAAQAVTGLSIQCKYGSDQYSNLQGAMTAAKAAGVAWYVPGGTYIVSQPLVAMPRSTDNNAGVSPPLGWLDPGATIIAGASMTTVLTYGSEASDYSGYLRQANFGGGNVDANFVATNAVAVPFAQECTRWNQQTKNALSAGAVWGSLTAPTAVAGCKDNNNTYSRDIVYIAIASITKANPPVVTTVDDHGMTTGRVVTLVVTGMTQANLKFFRITKTGAKTFTLDNTDSSGWSTFTGGNAALNMPSMSLPFAITGITKANPGVVTATGHGLSNGDVVFISNVGGMTQVDGLYTVAGATTNTFQLSGVDTSGYTTYTSGGYVEKYPDPTSTSVEKGIYLLSTADHDTENNTISGARYGIAARVASAGYDGKHIKNHIFNYDENGQTFAAILLAGKNTLTDNQCDGPVRFCWQFTAANNTVTGSRMTYTGSAALFSNYASFVRLETGATVNVLGGSIAGDSTYNVYASFSPFSALGAGYSNINLQSANVTATIGDGVNGGSFYSLNPSGNATLQARGTGESDIVACSTTAGKNGIYMYTATGYGGIAGIDNNCAFTADIIHFLSTGVVMPLALSVTGHVTFEGVTSTGATGTGKLVFDTSPALTTPNLGTPSAITLTNGTGLPVSSGISGLGTGVATFLATPSSANLAAALTDETGTGAAVFGTSPTFTTKITTPLIIGGPGTTGTQFTFQTTSGNGTTDQFEWKGGNNGGTSWATLAAAGLNVTGNGASVNINAVATTNPTVLIQATTTAGQAQFSVANTGTGMFGGVFFSGTNASNQVGMYLTTAGAFTASVFDFTSSAFTLRLPFVLTSTTDASALASGSLQTPGGASITKKLYMGDSIFMATAAKTLVLKQGANGSVGTFVCTSGGTITITNSNVAITDAIIISLNTVGGSISTNPTVNAITAATSFTAKCATSDTSTYNYAIIKNAAWLLDRDLNPANDNSPAFLRNVA